MEQSLIDKILYQEQDGDLSIIDGKTGVEIHQVYLLGENGRFSKAISLTPDPENPNWVWVSVAGEDGNGTREDIVYLHKYDLEGRLIEPEEVNFQMMDR